MTRAIPAPATIAVLLGGLAGLAPFALDTYLPAFPEIATSLASSSATVQQSLTSYLAPYTLMMLVHGPISDRYGRRASIIGALLFFCAGSLGCATAQSIESFLGWRMLQGLSVGATTVVGRALIRDLFEGPAAQRQFAHVNLVFTLAPVVAPILGGYLLTIGGWRSIFWFLLAYPLALLAVIWRWLPETLPLQSRSPLQAARIVGNLATFARSPGFSTLAWMAAASFCGFFAYILAAPTFVRDVLDLGPTQFGWLFIATASGTMLGSWWASSRSGTKAPSATIRLGLWLSAAAALANVGYHAMSTPAVPWSVLPLTLYCLGFALILPSATLLMLDTSPLPRGATSSLQSCAQLCCATLTSALIVPVVARSALLLSLAMLAWWVISGVSWLVFQRFAPTSLR
jgi:DHA1 family bicyclomycin/chloramphenicol resistance-like MFS transporter